MTPFDLDQTRERAFTENCWIQDSSTAAGLYIFINWWSEKDFEVIKRSKDWSVKETGAIYKHKFGYTDNPGQNIWNKVKKSSKIEQYQKNLATASAYFLGAFTKSLFVKRRLDTRLSTQFWHFLISSGVNLKVHSQVWETFWQLKAL